MEVALKRIYSPCSAKVRTHLVLKIIDESIDSGNYN